MIRELVSTMTPYVLNPLGSAFLFFWFDKPCTDSYNCSLFSLIIQGVIELQCETHFISLKTADENNSKYDNLRAEYCICQSIEKSCFFCFFHFKCSQIAKAKECLKTTTNFLKKGTSE